MLLLEKMVNPCPSVPLLNGLESTTTSAAPEICPVKSRVMPILVAEKPVRKLAVESGLRTKALEMV